MAQVSQWSSRFGFLMASIGFAVGLGNIWRFPYVTGENGGGVFALVYLGCVLLIGTPVLMAELMLGRRGGGSPVGAMASVAAAEGRSPGWRWVGALNLLTAFLIVFVYAVIAGWVFFYLFQAGTAGFVDFDVERSAATFAGLTGDLRGQLFWTAIALLLTGIILYLGVTAGIERVLRILLPLLFFLLLALAINNMFGTGFGRAFRYLFEPDWSKLNGGLVLAAVGQAFFSIGVAMAGMMTFGAYLPKQVSIARSVFIIISADTLVALLAGFVIFPVVFQFGLDPSSGSGLTFQTLPIAFGQMVGGQIVGTLFFLLLGVAAVSSMVGLVEPLIAWCENELNLSREFGVVLVLVTIWIFSLFSILSFGAWADWQFADRSFGGWLDFVPNEVLLPVGGFMIAVFAGWFVSASSAGRELAIHSRLGFLTWRTLIRYVVPPAIGVILISAFVG